MTADGSKGSRDRPALGLVDGLHRERLESGAGLWVLPLPGQTMVSVRLLIPAGAQYEEEGEAGLAHIVEHLAFDFTRSPEMAAIFNAAEDGGGEIGAVTGPEDVVFTAEVPRALLESTLELLCGCLLTASFQPERVEDERRVLLRELTDYAGRDQRDLSRAAWERLTAHHPSTRDPAGERAAVLGLPARRLEEFFRAHYGAGGQTLVIVGDLELDEARAAARRTVGALPPAAGPTAPPEPRGPGEALRFRDPEVWDELIVGYRTDGVRSPDYFAHWYTRDYLAEALYDDVRRSHHVYYLACDLVARGELGMLFVLVRAAEADHDSIVARIEESLEALGRGPLEASRFERLRARLVNRARRIAETSDEAAEHLLSLAVHYGLEERVPDDLRSLEEVTAEAIHQAARRCFVPERRVEGRSRRRRRSRRLVAGLVALSAVLAALGLQERCHREREAELVQQLEDCRETAPRPVGETAARETP